MANKTYRARIASDLFHSSPEFLGSYFRVYDNLIARSDGHVLQIEEPDSKHTQPIADDEILLAAEILRGDPTLTLEKAAKQLKTNLGASFSAQQLERAIQISVRAMLLLECTGHEYVWQPDERLVDFTSRCFPRALAPSGSVNKKPLKAWKLKARLRLKFKGTDNLARHLLLDPEHPDGPTLYLFRYTAFIKVQLDRLEREKFQKEDGMLECLRNGCLPPHLLAETLHSIQEILFHFDDTRSNRILEKLISKHGFDEECAQADSYKFFDDADKLGYRYWGERLAALQRFTNERPQTKFERWMKWQTSESKAFAVALAALIITIVVAIVTLGLAGFQTYIGWKAWKEPVSGDEEALLREIVALLRQQRGP